MKRRNYNTIRLTPVLLRCMILLISIFVIVKCVRILGSGLANDSSQSLKSNVVSAVCNYIIQSNIPILNYMAGSDDKKDGNIILDTMVGSFPINRYVAATIDDTKENVIQTDYKSPTLFIQGLNVLLNNMNEENRTYNQRNNASSSQNMVKDSNNKLLGVMPIDIISGETYLEGEDSSDDTSSEETFGSASRETFSVDQLMNRQFLYSNFYIVDSATVITDDLFDAKTMLSKDMTMKQDSSKPQILIYHTHSQEAYSDSRAGVEEDTVVGVGSYLTKLLTERFGLNVIHDKSKYDMMEGFLDRNLAYNHAADGIEKILKDNPSIEVIIDLHRDGVNKNLPQGQGKRLVNIDGKPTAKIMLLNGLSRDSKGEISRLKNPYLQDNLAFSLQLQLKGREMYAGLMHKNYLQEYRYNMHLRKKTLLVELGTDRNTLQEAMNAMDYFADVLDKVLDGDK